MNDLTGTSLRGFGAALAVATMLASAAATANTVTFDSLPSEDDIYALGLNETTYIENGITVTSTSGLLATYTSAGAAHVDDAGTQFTSGLSFTMSGAFSAVGMSLTSLGYAFYTPPARLLENIFVTGYLGGASVASSSYVLSDVPGTIQSILFDNTFGMIDRLQIDLLYVYDIADCDAPCGHFDLNDVTLSPIAPVPLPASGLFLLAVMAGLAGLAARRRLKRVSGAA